MPSRLRLFLTWLVLGLAPQAAPAHFNMLLPHTASVKRGEPVVVTYQWGHPFEHQLFDAPAPVAVSVRAPDGKTQELTRTLEKAVLAGAEGKKVTAYQLRWTPEQRGDHVLILRTPPIWLEEEKEFVQDTVKAIVHVQAQHGWEARANAGGLELLPLTRPYGLLPGMVFQAQAVAEPRQGPAPGLGGAQVEIERYNPRPPRTLPPDEFITRTARTDPNGVVTTTLTEAGWWGLTVQRDGGKKGHLGQVYPLRERFTLWVFVDEKVAGP